MVLLKAYFDDSGTHNHAKYSIIGGYLSTTEQWDSLSVEWNKRLNEWNLDWFHMTDAEARQGPYKHWNNENRDERVSQLSALIGKHAGVGITHAVPQQLFNERLISLCESDNDLKGEVTHAYVVSFEAMINAVELACQELGHQPRMLS